MTFVIHEVVVVVGSDEVVALGRSSVPDATILLGDGVLANSSVRSIVSLLLLVKLPGLLGSHPEVGGVGKNCSRVSMLRWRATLLKITYIDDMLGPPDDYMKSYRPKER